MSTVALGAVAAGVVIGLLAVGWALWADPEIRFGRRRPKVDGPPRLVIGDVLDEATISAFRAAFFENVAKDLCAVVTEPDPPGSYCHDDGRFIVPDPVFGYLYAEDRPGAEGGR
jgi:hypothetical protein